MCALCDRPERFSCGAGLLISKRTGCCRRIAPSVPRTECHPGGNFPEIVAAGSFLPESFIRTCQYRACTFGAPPDIIFTHGVSSLLRLIFNCGLHCTSKPDRSQVIIVWVSISSRDECLSPGQRATHPVTHQPVFEILVLIDLDRCNNAINNGAHR